MAAPSCLEGEEGVVVVAVIAVVVGALLPASESCRSCSHLSRSSLATDSVVTEAFQNLERRREIVIVSGGEEKMAVVSEGACRHSLETPGWGTERRREAKTPEGIAAGAEFAPW